VSFPATPFPYVTELLINGSWIDITADVRDTSDDPGPQITRGRANESDQTTATTCNLTLANPDGTYSNRLPTSPYYGLLGRNTQLRHRLRWVQATFTGATSNSWPVCDTGQTWTNTGGSASNYNGTGTKGTHTLTSVAVKRRSTITLPVMATDITVTVSVSAVMTGGPGTVWLNFGTDANNFYTCRPAFLTDGTVRLDVYKWVGGVETALASNLVIGSYAAGTEWSFRLQHNPGGRIRVAGWLTSSNPASTTWQLEATDATFSTFTNADLESRLEAGNTNTNPVFSFDDFEVNDFRFWGEVPSWPQTWDTSGSDVTAPIEAAGIMRRLGAGAKPLRSAMYRTMAGLSVNDLVPDHYLPMEDGSDATQFGPATAGAPATPIGTGVSPGSDNTLVGSGSLPIFAAGAEQPVLVPTYSASDRWYLQFVMKFDSRPTVNAVLFEGSVSGAGSGLVRVQLRIDVTTSATMTTFYFEGFDGAGTLQSSVLFNTGGALTEAQLYGSYHSFIIGAEPDTPSFPADFRLVFGISNPQNIFTGYAYGFFIPSPTGAPGKLAGYKIRNSGTAPFSAGHFGIFTNAFNVFDEGNANAAGMAGHAGETAADRMARLCREEGIAFTLIGNASDTQLVGPQQAATLLTNLQACADVDHGILGEPRDAFGLLYRTNRSMLNQTGPALDYAAKRLAPPLRPTDDDQQVRNRVTAARIGGSSATAELTSGSLSTQDPPSGIGLYDEQVTVNSYTDGQLPYIAGWRVRLGTWDEARFPQVSVNFARLLMDGQTALAGQVAAVDAGDYLSITNPPAWLPPDQIELLAQGYRETHRGFEWLITYNAVPSGPYNAFIIGDQTDGRLDTSGCIVNEAVTSSATSLKLCIWDGPPSITTAARPGDFPFDLALRPAPLDANTGERVRVTAMASATAPTFVAAGTASSGSSGSRTPGMPAGVVGGDVVLIFASTRNSGTGTVDTPADWASLLSFGNMALLGRVYDGVWTMPTVTFTGGAANEDTLAQSAAFRNMCFDLSRIVHSSNTQLNASAQNIATPLLGVRRDRCVVLHLGWKQDDYTSVAALSGSTEIQELFSTAGNDASQIWDYRIQTTAVGIDETSFVVTGGASAISRSAVVALVGGYQTATVTRSINGVSMAQAAGTPASLWRPARPAL